MNKVIECGRLTADPKINDAITLAQFTLAVDRKFKQEGQPTADFINCKLLGQKQADFANRYLRKGMKILVEGRIQTGSYKNRDGQTVYKTDVIVENTEFVEGKNTSQQQSNSGGLPNMPSTDADGFMNIPDGIDEELPFN